MDFKKISRLNNTMWDKSYSFDSGAYTNLAGFSHGYAVTTPGGDEIRRVIPRGQYRRELATGVSTKFNGVTLESYSYAYDALSRPTTRNSDTFGYNERGEVVFSRRDAENAEDAYAYDGNGTVSTISGATTNITEIQYFWGTDLSETLQGAGGAGGLLAVSINGDFYFPSMDNNGNVTKYIDENGNVVAAYEYDVFGRTISSLPILAFRSPFCSCTRLAQGVFFKEQARSACRWWPLGGRYPCQM